MTRPVRKLCLLAVLLLATFTGILATTPPQSAYAAVCCENCPFFYEQCLRGSRYNCNGNPECCAEATEGCYWTCIYC